MKTYKQKNGRGTAPQNRSPTYGTACGPRISIIGQGWARLSIFLPSINDHKERRRVSRTDHFRKCPPCPSHRPQPWAFAMIDGSRPQWRLDEISRVLTKNISEECAWHSQTIKRNKKRSSSRQKIPTSQPLHVLIIMVMAFGGAISLSSVLCFRTHLTKVLYSGFQPCWPWLT